MLWDEAHLWGVLMTRVLAAWGLPHRLVLAREVAGGLLTRQPPMAVVVPGGFANRKSVSLGPAGLDALRGYVVRGGAYLGVCGGAGLGLTTPGGLALCPWTREPFLNRLQHFASGHVHLKPNRDSAFAHPGLTGEPLAPVWWPAKFRAAQDGVEVVGAYGEPGPDFMMADIPLARVDSQTLADWEKAYGVRLAPGFSQGDPCIVAGEAGLGRYLLSHAHLETPDSPQANTWLAHILERLTGIRPPGKLLPAPAWDLGQDPPAWEDQVLEEAMAKIMDVVRLGMDHGLLAWRESWLLGWRQGLPGAQLNGLLAMLDQARRLTPNQTALDFWRTSRQDLGTSVERLAKGLSGYLLAERLATTLWRVDPKAVPEHELKAARLALFGPPPSTQVLDGGFCGQALAVLEQFIWLCSASVNGC